MLLREYSVTEHHRRWSSCNFNYGASGDAHIAVVEDIVNGVPYVSESGYAFGTTVPAADRLQHCVQVSEYLQLGRRKTAVGIYLSDLIIEEKENKKKIHFEDSFFVLLCVCQNLFYYVVMYKIRSSFCIMKPVYGIISLFCQVIIAVQVVVRKSGF